MPWYLTFLLVIVILMVLLFVVFITNGDGKMIEIVYDMLSHYHDTKEKNDRI